MNPISNGRVIIALSLFLLAIVTGSFYYLFGHSLVTALYNSGIFSLIISLPRLLTFFDSIFIATVIALIAHGASFLVVSRATVFIERLSYLRPKRAVIMLSFIALGLSTFFSYFVLQRFPNSADEYSYIFGAMTFSNGVLWNVTHPMQDVFNTIHIFANEGKWVTRFPPGWPLMLFLLNNLGIPFWLVNTILSALVVYVFFSLALMLHGKRIATIATVALILSSFFLFNGASYFSHMCCLLLVLLFYFHSLVCLEEDNWKYAFLAGIWIGFAFITRPYTAVLIVIPLLILVMLKHRTKLLKHLPLLILGSSPFAAFLFYYNYQITGDPFLMVTQWIDNDEGLGFIRGHSPFNAVLHSLLRLSNMLLWASPFLLPIFVAAIYYFKTTVNRKDLVWLIFYSAVFFTLVLGFAFYWNFGGNQYGPRFYFEGFPFLLLAVTVWVFGESELETKKSELFRNLYVAGVLWSIIFMPFHAYTEHGVIEERRDLYQLVEDKNISNAIVLLTNGTGVIRHMPLPDLTRNGISLTADVLYGKDLGRSSYRDLQKYFPERKLYRYVRESKSKKGELIAINLV